MTGWTFPPISPSPRISRGRSVNFSRKLALGLSAAMMPVIFSMGGLVMNLVAGRLLDLGFGYETVFSVVGTLHVLGFCVILLTIRQIRPLSFTP